MALPAEFPISLYIRVAFNLGIRDNLTLQRLSKPIRRAMIGVGIGSPTPILLTASHFKEAVDLFRRNYLLKLPDKVTPVRMYYPTMEEERKGSANLILRPVHSQGPATHLQPQPQPQPQPPQMVEGDPAGREREGLGGEEGRDVEVVECDQDGHGKMPPFKLDPTEGKKCPADVLEITKELLMDDEYIDFRACLHKLVQPALGVALQDSYYIVGGGGLRGAGNKESRAYKAITLNLASFAANCHAFISFFLALSLSPDFDPSLLKKAVELAFCSGAVEMVKLLLLGNSSLSLANAIFCKLSLLQGDLERKSKEVLDHTFIQCFPSLILSINESIQKGMWINRKIPSRVMEALLSSTCIAGGHVFNPTAYDGIVLKSVCKYGNFPALIPLLKDERINPNMNGNEAFKLAVESGSVACVQLLLNDNRSDPGYDGNLFLITAIRRGFMKTVEVLLKSGRIDAAFPKHNPYFVALEAKNQEIVDMVLAAEKLLWKPK